MAPFIEFIHVLCGVTFFGIAIASFVYVTSSIKQKNTTLLHYALQTSLLADCLIFPIIIILFLSGTVMVHDHHLSFNTPWIIVAYAAFIVVSMIWILLVWIKYRHFISKKTAPFRFKKTFIVLNIVMILIFCMIVHDAVTQQTWLWR